MVVTVLWQFAATLRAGPGQPPAYYLGIPTVYPALLCSLGALVFISMREMPSPLPAARD